MKVDRSSSVARALMLTAVPLFSAAVVFVQQTADVEAALRDALTQYSTALESLDVEAVQEIQPSIDARRLERAFREMEALEVEIDEINILSVDDDTARVSCRVTQTLTPRAGSEQTSAVSRIMRLRQTDDTWVIDGFER